MDNSFLCFSISWACWQEQRIGGDSARGGWCRGGSQPAAHCGPRVHCTWSEYECAKQLLTPCTEAASKAPGGSRCISGNAGWWVLCTVLLLRQNLADLGLWQLQRTSAEITKGEAGWLVFHPVRTLEWILSSKPAARFFGEFPWLARERWQGGGTTPVEGRVSRLSLKDQTSFCSPCHWLLEGEKRIKQVRSRCFT